MDEQKKRKQATSIFTYPFRVGNGVNSTSGKRKIEVERNLNGDWGLFRKCGGNVCVCVCVHVSLGGGGKVSLMSLSVHLCIASEQEGAHFQKSFPPHHSSQSRETTTLPPSLTSITHLVHLHHCCCRVTPSQSQMSFPRKSKKIASFISIPPLAQIAKKTKGNERLSPLRKKICSITHHFVSQQRTDIVRHGEWRGREDG